MIPAEGCPGLRATPALASQGCRERPFPERIRQKAYALECKGGQAFRAVTIMKTRQEQGGGGGASEGVLDTGSNLSS